MLTRPWKREVARLEKAGNDDFLLILTGGAAAYATHELHHFLRRIRLQAIKVRKLRNFMFKTGLALPFFMFAACMAGLVGWLPLAYIFLVGIPLSVLTLVGISWFLTANFSCIDRSKRLRCIIQQELERRRKGATA